MTQGVFQLLIRILSKDCAQADGLGFVRLTEFVAETERQAHCCKQSSACLTKVKYKAPETVSNISRLFSYS